MSDNGPHWFGVRRYGLGAGRPISWQGWALTLGFIAAVVAASILLAERPLVLAAVVVPLVLLFVAISARTTRGAWRWRWGDDS